MSQTEEWRAYVSLVKEVREQIRQIRKDLSLFRNALTVFTQQYGLLGLFEEDFQGKPVLPEGKTCVAPEALIDERGWLRRFDPATNGKELLFRVLDRKWQFSDGHNRPADDFERRVAYNTMALPSEIAFVRRGHYLGGRLEWLIEPRPLVPWEEIKKDYGVVLILDEGAPDGVSVLCTREPICRWEMSFRFLPSAAPSGALELDEDGYVSLNTYLEDVSPRAFVSVDGNLERGWRYRSLLQAMYVMLFLDLTGGSTIKKCESRGCPNYFRVGPQSRSKYCSNRCANRASTRMGRGQVP